MGWLGYDSFSVNLEGYVFHLCIGGGGIIFRKFRGVWIPFMYWRWVMQSIDEDIRHFRIDILWYFFVYNGSQF